MTSGTRRQQERRRSVLMLPTFCNDPDYCAQHHGRASAERNQTMRRLVTSLETWIFTSCSRRSGPLRLRRFYLCATEALPDPGHRREAARLAKEGRGPPKTYDLVRQRPTKSTGSHCPRAGLLRG